MIKTLKKVTPLLKEFTVISKDVESISINANEFVTHTTEKIERTSNLTKKAMNGITLWALFKAVRNEYHESDKKGMKEINNSAYRVIQKKQAKSTLQKTLRTLIK